MKAFQLAALALAQVLVSSAAFAGVAVITPVNVPEPATLTVLAAGLGGLAMVRKLRKRK